MHDCVEVSGELGIRETVNGLRRAIAKRPRLRGEAGEREAPGRGGDPNGLQERVLHLLGHGRRPLGPPLLRLVVHSVRAVLRELDEQ